MKQDIYRILDRKIESGEVKVCVLGLGYVGLPLALEFAKRFKVLGYDKSQKTIQTLKSGQSHIDDISPLEVKKALKTNFRPTTEVSDIAAADFIIICVPTPLKENYLPDLSYIKSAAQTISKQLRRGQCIILESTTFPGTTENQLRNWLETGSGLKAGMDFSLAFSPERIDPGNKKFKVSNITKIVGGLTPRDSTVVAKLYSTILDSPAVIVADAKTAESVKLMENIFRHVNIALVNEMALVMEKMDIDVWEVIKAAATKPYGYMAFYPGPGVGGHCIPLDPHYLSFAARQKGIRPKFIELSSDINNFMKVHAVNLVQEGLKSQGVDISDSTVSILGLSYKKDISDTRESPAKDIIRDLSERGAHVKAYDPFVKSTDWSIDNFVLAKSVESLFQDSNAVLILVDHTSFKKIQFARLIKSMKTAVIVDTRNVVPSAVRTVARLIRLGTGDTQKSR